MADMKSGVFAKNVQKRLSRAQEKVLQKLGKADETKDEQFEEYIQNFKRQEAEGSRLQKELRGYLAAIKGMQDASQKLTESLHEVYEPEWYGREDVKIVGEKYDVLWEDFHQKLVDGSLLTLDTYLGQFPDIKNRIAKRSRKLVDYDSARHHLEALQSSKRKDEGRISKAEEEFQKAQKVFEDFNTDLQEELPTLWTRRVGFYVTTFKNISSLEAKFHKEIALLCHKLYEVMNKLGEQHADKAFTIQGAPSDSGPLRIAKTPSPPEEDSPPLSPEASPNHNLAPASPAPARPKSPSQLRKGPPVPPLPKLTPTKELQQENIISLFDDNFVPEINVTTPSQNEVPEEKKQETLLDFDFDPFKPDAAAPVPSPMSQTLPWDLWTTSSELVQPAPNSAFNGFTQDTSLFSMQSSQNVVDNMTEAEEAPPVELPAEEAPSAPDVAASVTEPEVQPMEAGEPAAEPVDAVEAEIKETTGLAEKECELQMDSVIEGPVVESEDVGVTPVTEVAAAADEVAAVAGTEDGKLETEAKAAEETQETLSNIPSVVIEPASNNDGEGEHHETVVVNESKEIVEDIGSESHAEAPSDPKLIKEVPTATSEEQPASRDDGMPSGFLFKVETLHDFEAAGGDELNLLRGEIVLVIPSAETDQDAGWLTGIKESDWLQYKDAATYKGLFPENFTRRLE